MIGDPASNVLVDRCDGNFLMGAGGELEARMDMQSALPVSTK